MSTNLGYKIRLAKLDGYESLLQDLVLVPDYTRILAVSHVGDSKENPHWHLVVETAVKEKAFRKRMMTLFNKGKGNGHCSISPYDKPGIEPYSYMFHEEGENAQPVINKGHSNEDILSYIKRNDEVQVLVNEAKKKASWRLEEMAYEDFVKNRGHKCCPSAEDVGIRIMELALENDIYPPQDWLLKTLVFRLVHRLSDESTREVMIRWHVRKVLRLD